MIDKPDLKAERIIACLQEEYDLFTDRIRFLPVGADYFSAVYHVVSTSNTHYFLKVKSRNFNKISLELPKILSDQGITGIMPAITTKTGKLWANLDTHTIVLYPYINGQNGYSVKLSDQQWSEFGATLKRIHAVNLPQELKARIRKETFTQQWCEQLSTTLQDLDTHEFHDPIAADAAIFMQSNVMTLYNLINRTEDLIRFLQNQTLEYVVCHSDIHAGNVLIDADNAFYIVDWDEPIIAPRERDLMYIGGAQGFIGYTAQEEETLFFKGYGSIVVNPYAMAYYRYGRIVEDIAIESKRILWSDNSNEDREQSLIYLKSNFSSNGTIETAYQGDNVGLY